MAGDTIHPDTCPERFIGIIDPQGRKAKANKISFVCPTLRAQIHGNPPCAVYEVREQVGEHCKNQAGNEKGFIECVVGGAVDLSYPNSKTRRGRVQDGGRICPTITAQTTGICVIEKSPNPEKPLDILGKPVIL